VALSDLNSYARQTAIQDLESLPARALRGDLQQPLFTGNGEVTPLGGFGLGRILKLAWRHMRECFIKGTRSSFVEIALWVVDDQPNAGRERAKQPLRYIRANITRYIQSRNGTKQEKPEK
jgi:hypothetical protein